MSFDQKWKSLKKNNGKILKPIQKTLKTIEPCTTNKASLCCEEVIDTSTF